MTKLPEHLLYDAIMDGDLPLITTLLKPRDVVTPPHERTFSKSDEYVAGFNAGIEAAADKSWEYHKHGPEAVDTAIRELEMK